MKAFRFLTPHQGVLILAILWVASMGCSASRLVQAKPDSLGPMQVAVGCTGVFHKAPTTVPAWLLPKFSLSDCQSGVTHDVKQVYDDCQPVGWTLTACDLRPGLEFCQSGYWTTLCFEDANCPRGMRCVWRAGVGDVPAGEYGSCSKTCVGDGRAGDCVRCDLRCDQEQKVCRPRSEPPPQG